MHRQKRKCSEMTRAIGLYFFIVFATLAFASNSVGGAPPTTRPWPITYREEVCTSPPLHIHVVILDMSDARVHVRVSRGAADPDGPGRWTTKLVPVREMAKRDSLDIAVNGNFFAGRDQIVIAGVRNPYYPGNWAIACGFAMSDGEQWGSPLASSGPSLVFDDAGHPQIDQFAGLPRNARQGVTGSEWLVTDGVASTHAADLAPRTAAGIDRAGRTLCLVVVDGRRPDYSVGMTIKELGDYLKTLGCWRAINLDGGGSSTMVLRKPGENEAKLVNRPSDGHDWKIPMSFERAVADALGVTVDRDASTAPTTSPTTSPAN